MRQEAALVAAELETITPLFEGNLAFSEVRNRVIASICDGEDKIAAEIGRGRAPLEICLGAISQASRLEVVYGNHFFYRGMLTLFGANMFGVWKIAMSELVQMGFVSPGTYSERLAEIEAAVAETG